MKTEYMNPKTIYIDPEIDNQLRAEAIATKTHVTDLINMYLRIGIKERNRQRNIMHIAEKYGLPLNMNTFNFANEVLEKISAV